MDSHRGANREKGYRNLPGKAKGEPIESYDLVQHRQAEAQIFYEGERTDWIVPGFVRLVGRTKNRVYSARPILRQLAGRVRGPTLSGPV